MNLYVDAKALFKYENKIIDLFKNDNNLSIFCILENKFELYKAHRIIKRKIRVFPNYIFNIRILDRKLIDFYNNGKAKIELLVSNKISSYHKKLLAKSLKIIKVNDNTDSKQNFDYYCLSKNLVYVSKFGSNLEDAISFELSYFNNTNLTCHHSSCLGNNLYLNKNGDFYFCFSHLNESFLKNIKLCENIDSIFESETFNNSITRAIKKRKLCKEKCTVFNKCNGACPLVEFDCKKFVNAIVDAKKLREKILKSNENLNELELFKKESILEEVCKCPK